MTRVLIEIWDNETKWATSVHYESSGNASSMITCCLKKEGNRLLRVQKRNDATISKFLESLVSITIHDCGVSTNAIVRVLKLARLRLESGGSAVLDDFTSLSTTPLRHFSHQYCYGRDLAHWHPQVSVHL